MAQLPLIRQNQAANAHIDGATPSYLPTSINQPNQNMPHRSELSQGRRQNNQERHQSCPKTGGKTTRKDIRVIPRQEAKPPGKTSELSFLGHRWRNCLLSWDNSDRCGIFWLGWLMDVGRNEGVAPSMWAFPAWFWRTSGSCAIYVPKRQLDVEKKMGETSAVQIFHLGSPRKTDPPPSVKFPLANSGKNSFSGDLVGSVFRGQAKWQSGKLPERRRLQKIAPKSGCKCPHRWRNSLISPDIHQPT